MRDQQRSKVYAWERKHLQGSTDVRLELREIQQLINRVARHYKTKAPRVTDGRGRRVACWSPWQFAIKLPRWARTRVVALHEAAHWIEDVLYGDRAAHGREFVSIFMYLLVKYHGADRSELARTANDMRVDFGDTELCKPKHRQK